MKINLLFILLTLGLASISSSDAKVYVLPWDIDSFKVGALDGPSRFQVDPYGKPLSPYTLIDQATGTKVRYWGGLVFCGVSLPENGPLTLSSSNSTSRNDDPYNTAMVAFVAKQTGRHVIKCAFYNNFQWPFFDTLQQVSVSVVHADKSRTFLKSRAFLNAEFMNVDWSIAVNLTVGDYVEFAFVSAIGPTAINPPWTSINLAAIIADEADADKLESEPDGLLSPQQDGTAGFNHPLFDQLSNDSGTLALKTVPLRIAQAIDKTRGESPDSLLAPISQGTTWESYSGLPEAFGICADGVTTALLQFDSTKIRNVRVRTSEGSVIANISPFFPGAAVPTASFPVTNGSYFQIPAGRSLFLFGGITPQNLHLEQPARSVEVIFELLDSWGLPKESQFLRVALPPVALIHGHNLSTDWGKDFLALLSQNYPTPDFVNVVRYGLSSSTNDDAYAYGTLNELAPILSEKLATQLESHRDTSKYAFTRYDLVCHSQGGVLARMLCSEATNGSIPAFRSKENANRGRFFRVVTIGSPHNGSRLARYLYDIVTSEKLSSKFYENGPGIRRLIPESLFQSLLPDWLPGARNTKFDPFGPQIRALNTSKRWQPDGSARFHFIATTVDHFGNIALASIEPSYKFLSLGGGDYSKVIPLGSDAIVDSFSQTAGLSFEDPRVTAFSSVPVSHSGFNSISSSGGERKANQANSSEIAARIASLLSGPLDPQFGSFPKLLPLGSKDRADIDETAASQLIEVAAIMRDTVSPTKPLDARKASLIGSEYTFRLILPTNISNAGEFSWAVEVLGQPDLSGVTLTIGQDPSYATVGIDSSVIGDVLLYASFRSSNGYTFIPPPFKVATVRPQSKDIIGISVDTGGRIFSPGSMVNLKIRYLFDDGTSLPAYVDGNDIAIKLSSEKVFSIVNEGIIVRRFGTSLVTVTLGDWSATATIQSGVAGTLPSPSHFFGTFVKREPSSQFFGTLKLAVLSNGSFSGRMNILGKTIPVKGVFDGFSRATVTGHSSAESNSLSMKLGYAEDIAYVDCKLNWNDDAVEFSAQCSAPRTAPAPVARSTAKLEFPSDGYSDDRESPKDSRGWAISKMKGNRIIVVGTLPDGQHFSSAGDVTQLEQFPLFAPLYKAKGVLVGNISASRLLDSPIQGRKLYWSKPARQNDRYFPLGFTIELDLMGEAYQSASRHTCPLNLESQQAEFTFSANSDISGNSDLSIDLIWSAAGKFSAQTSSRAFSISHDSKSGRFRGNFVIPSSGGTRKFSGVFLQKSRSGLGLFLNDAAVGTVRISE